MAKRQYLDLTGLTNYDEKIKALIETKEDAGVAQSKVNALAEGQVKTNTEAIAAINNAETGILKTSKDYTDAQVAAEKSRAEGKEAENATAASNAQAAADEAKGGVTALQGRMSTVEGNIGTVDELDTSAKVLVDAINEVKASVSAGGEAAAITLTTAGTATEGMLKTYVLKQGTSEIGKIDIPKDMVVESGSVVENPEGQAAGTYIKLVLANVADPIYINAAKLVDIYTAAQNATQVQLAISATGEISAELVAGGVTVDHLASNSVTTVKIVDKNVTKAKLADDVQASLGKADAAAPQSALDEEVARATAAEAKALTDGKAYTDEKVGAETTRATGVEDGLASRITNLETAVGTGGSVVDQINTAKEEAIEEAVNQATAAAASDATTKANNAKTAAVSEAKTYTDEQVADAKAEAAAASGKNATDITNLTARVSANETNITGNTTNISSNTDRIAALEGKVGDGFEPIPDTAIDALFE